MDEQNTLIDVQEEVVDPWVEEAELGDEAMQETAYEEAVEPRQSRELNERMKQFRLEAENARNEQEETLAKLLRAQELLGVEGDDMDALCDEHMTDEQAVNEELIQLREFRHLQMMDADIRTINEVYPEAKLSVNNVPEELLQMLTIVEIMKEQGLVEIDPVTTFEMMMSQYCRHNKPSPKPIGAVNGKKQDEKTYYTNAELDALTSEQLDDLKTFEKAMRSLSRLGK